LPDRALAARGNLAILAGLEARRQGEREAAEQAFEEALRLFEQSIMPEFSTRVRYVRQLLADQRGPSAASTTDELVTSEPPNVSAPPSAPELVAAEAVAAGASAPRARRRWWPWGR